METRGITVPGGSLQACSSGAPANPATVLVHSGITHAPMWFPLMRALDDEVFGVAYDCRCFGRSTTTLDGEFSDVADLGSVLDAYGLESAVLVGESRGRGWRSTSRWPTPGGSAGCSCSPPTSRGSTPRSRTTNARCTTRSRRPRTPGRSRS